MEGICALRYVPAAPGSTTVSFDSGGRTVLILGVAGRALPNPLQSPSTGPQARVASHAPSHGISSISSVALGDILFVHHGRRVAFYMDGDIALMRLRLV